MGEVLQKVRFNFGHKLVVSLHYLNYVFFAFLQALRGVESANFEFPLFTKDEQRVEILLNATARYANMQIVS